MLEINDVIDLKTNDGLKKLIFATRYLVQTYYTFDLTVKSSSFSGTSHFCVRKEQIEDFLENLIKIQNITTAKALLEDNDSDGFVEIASTDKLGHINVTAQAGGTHEDHVKTSFVTDQTSLAEFISEFQTLLSYKDTGN